MKIPIRLIKLIDCSGGSWLSLLKYCVLHGSLVVMVDLHGSSANTYPFSRFAPDLQIDLKETVHNSVQYLRKIQPRAPHNLENFGKTSTLL